MACPTKQVKNLSRIAKVPACPKDIWKSMVKTKMTAAQGLHSAQQGCYLICCWANVQNRLAGELSSSCSRSGCSCRWCQCQCQMSSCSQWCLHPATKISKDHRSTSQRIAITVLASRLCTKSRNYPMYSVWAADRAALSADR